VQVENNRIRTDKKEQKMPTTIANAAPGDTCTEFRIKVMIFSPESGFKFDVTVQRKCFPTKFVVIFNLFKKIGNEFVQIVGVEFEAEKKEDKRAVEAIAANGINVLQSRAFTKKVFPLVRDNAPEERVDNEISKAIKQ
jgi:hypothetical protein